MRLARFNQRKIGRVHWCGSFRADFITGAKRRERALVTKAIQGGYESLAPILAGPTG